MEGIGLSNMMGAEEMKSFFGEQKEQPSEAVGDNSNDPAVATEENNEENNETAEVDFSNLFGETPESVGSGESEKAGGASASEDDLGTPRDNLFSSIAQALKDEDVFPGLSDDTIKNIQDADALKKLFEDELSKRFDERQRRIEQALNSGATPDEVQQYQADLNIANWLSSRENYDAITKEGEEGDTLRKQVMYQDYVNRGFPHERAVKMIERSFNDGTELEDAKEAFQACKDFYTKRLKSYEDNLSVREQQKKAEDEKHFESLKKHILDTENFYGGVQVDKSVRQKAYEALTKPVYKDEQGNYLTLLQQYQKEHPIEFMENVAMMYSLTDGFKNVDKLTKKQINAGIKKGFAEVASVLNTTKRNGDGSLNLANSAPDLDERSNWTLAV